MTATVLGTAAAVCWIYLLALHGGFWRIRPEPARVPALWDGQAAERIAQIHLMLLLLHDD